MRALVVEDEPQLAKATARVLGALGFLTITSGDGEAALQVIRSGDLEDEIDLIVCDGHLPRLNGREFHDLLSPQMQKRCIFFTGAHGGLFDGLPNRIVHKPDFQALRAAVALQTGVRIP